MWHMQQPEKAVTVARQVLASMPHHFAAKARMVKWLNERADKAEAEADAEDARAHLGGDTPSARREKRRQAAAWRSEARRLLAEGAQTIEYPAACHTAIGMWISHCR